MKITVLFCLALLLAGCGSSQPEWNEAAKPSYPPDNYECTRDAYANGHVSGDGYRVANTRLYRVCMTAKGYTEKK